MNSFNNINAATEQQRDFDLATVFEVGSNDLIFGKSDFHFASEVNFNPESDFKIINEYDLSIKSDMFQIEDIVAIHAPDPYYIGNEIIVKVASNDAPVVIH